MPDTERIRISLSANELEVEGSPEFVAKYEPTIQLMLERLAETPVQPRVAGPANASPEAGTAAVAAPVDARGFGELLHDLPKSATGTDQILVAGWHHQQTTADSSFTTADANQLLLGQGIKLSNAAQAMRGNLSGTRVFKVSGNRWRVSRQGEEHLKTLLGG